MVYVLNFVTCVGLLFKGLLNLFDSFLYLLLVGEVASAFPWGRWVGERVMVGDEVRCYGGNIWDGLLLSNFCECSDLAEFM